MMRTITLNAGQANLINSALVAYGRKFDGAGEVKLTETEAALLVDALEWLRDRITESIRVYGYEATVAYMADPGVVENLIDLVSGR